MSSQEDASAERAERTVMDALHADEDTLARRRARRRRRSSEADEATATLDLGAPMTLRARDLDRFERTSSGATTSNERHAKSRRIAPSTSVRSPSEMNTSDLERNAATFANAFGVDAAEVVSPGNAGVDPYRAIVRCAEKFCIDRDGAEHSIEDVERAGEEEDEAADNSRAVVLTSASLMEGVRAFFVNFTKKRAEALGSVLIRMGGSVCERADDSVTHVVACEESSALTKALESIDREDVVKITPEWITESYKQRRRLPVSATNFEPRTRVAVIADRPHSQEAATSSGDSKALAVRVRKERENALAIRRSSGFGTIWTSDLVDNEKLEKSRSKFSCQPGEHNEKAMPIECNTKVADLLKGMADIYEDALRDQYRAKQYAAAASALRSLNFEITSINDCDVVPMLKKKDGKIRKYVGEILNTGKLKALEELRARPDVKACLELCGIHGVGPVTARSLFAKGYATVADLRARAPENLLTPAQKIGLKYYEEFKERIPREEVGFIATAVREAANTFQKDEVHCYCVGSFRRGKETSGDIDVLVACRDYSLANELLMHILSDLRPGGTSPRSGILTDDLLVGDHTYMGVAALLKPLKDDDDKPPIHRRVDIKVYDSESLPTALLYFTGSDKFNRSMRLWAKKKGFNLQDKGLFADRSQAQASRVRAKGEEDVFDALGLDYVPPERRNV